ncbi:hypothetical protein [Methylomonas koyamae]|uniref:Uncharacterized protein n=1 Tax=Methylomonas koyamae TaxID=702114 RepID=A0AA91D8F4_9GAMM|nr:hypothetical protein [Methylomonas koyamae]OAI21259.1 hypothetical protein A1356_21340 [Methylomonas koyamae]
MRLSIENEKKHYKSNKISNGKIISNFFASLARNIFNQSYKFWIKSEELGLVELPLLNGERNLYSTIAVGIDKLTPLHLSECSFNKSEHTTLEKSRRVDIWCLYRNGQKGKPINFFLEIKKGWYNLNGASKENFNSAVHNDFISLIDQTKTLKNLSPNWGDYDDVFLGISVIEGYYSEGKEYWDAEQVKSNVVNLAKEHNLEESLLFSTWYLPESKEVQWLSNKCRFIMLVGIVMYSCAGKSE